MDCNEFIQLVPLYLDGEMGQAEEEDFLKHVADCKQCATNLQPEERFHSLLRKRLRPAPAPVDLRRSVMKNMHTSKKPKWFGYSSFVAAAAAVTLFFVWNPLHETNLPATVQAAMIRQPDFSLPLDVSTDNPDDIRQFFHRHLPFNFSVPKIPNTVMRGGRMTYLQNYPAAVVRYEINGHPAALYIYQDPSAKQFIAAQRAGYRLIRSKQQARNALVWQQDEIIYSLIGDVQEESAPELIRTISAGRIYR